MPEAPSKASCVETPERTGGYHGEDRNPARPVRHLYPDEKACARYFYRLRMRGGWACSACGPPSHSPSRPGRPRTTPPHAPLRKWFLAAYLVAYDKRDVSICRLSREPDVRLEYACYLLGRLRSVMVESKRLQHP